jgi:opacity protein-like surface antigen
MIAKQILLLPTRSVLVMGAAAAALVAAAPAGAAGGNIGIHAGYAKAADAQDGNGLVGGHVELRPIPWLGLQGAVDYRLVETYALDTGPVDGELDVRSVPITASARLYIPGVAPVSLFGVAGAGWYHIIYDYSEELEDLGADDESESTFGWHLGAGLDVHVTPSVSLYGEGRAVFVDPERSLDEEVFDDVEEFNYDSTYFAGGLSFHF